MTDGFFDLRATHNPNRWFLPVTPSLCVGPPGNVFLFGGVGLAASVAAMERTTGRPLIWATAQYLSYARPPSIVDLDVHVPVHGKHTSQARVIGHVGDSEIFTVNAALGSRPPVDGLGDLSHQWVEAPDAPAPAECKAGLHWRDEDEDLHSRLEVRVAHGRYRDGKPSGDVSADGRMLLWIRPRQSHPVDSSLLAIVADFVPSGVGNALGLHAGGNSLDNTLRVRCLEQTEWILCDISIQGVHGGFGHGAMHLFSERGTLMATASQSVIVRMFRPPTR